MLNELLHAKKQPLPDTAGKGLFSLYKGSTAAPAGYRPKVCSFALGCQAAGTAKFTIFVDVGVKRSRTK